MQVFSLVCCAFATVIVLTNAQQYTVEIEETQIPAPEVQPPAPEVQAPTVQRSSDDFDFNPDNPPALLELYDDDPRCHRGVEKFERECIDKFKGIIDGGRCFFFNLLATNWNEAWGQCKGRGGELAQIHTGREFKKIGDYLRKSKVPGYQWVALKRDDTVKKSKKAIDPESTFWFESASRYDYKMTAGNTYIRNHVNDNPFNVNMQCMVIYGDYKRFGDRHCISHKHAAVCVALNVCQSFLWRPKTCMHETAFKAMEGVSIMRCAKSCAHEQWCRSFNFYAGSGICQLFSFIDSETDRQDKSTPNCFHYSYEM